MRKICPQRVQVSVMECTVRSLDELVVIGINRRIKPRVVLLGVGNTCAAGERHGDSDSNSNAPSAASSPIGSCNDSDGVPDFLHFSSSSDSDFGVAKVGRKRRRPKAKPENIHVPLDITKTDQEILQAIGIGGADLIDVQTTLQDNERRDEADAAIAQPLPTSDNATDISGPAASPTKPFKSLEVICEEAGVEVRAGCSVWKKQHGGDDVKLGHLRYIGGHALKVHCGRQGEPCCHGPDCLFWSRFEPNGYGVVVASAVEWLLQGLHMSGDQHGQAAINEMDRLKNVV